MIFDKMNAGRSYKNIKRILILSAGILALSVCLFGMCRIMPESREAAAMREETGEEPSTVSIYTMEDFLAFAENVNQGNDYEGEYINLYTDLDFSGMTQNLTVGTGDDEQCRFKGIFDGNAHRIRNLEIRSDADAGLFRNLGGTVCNLVIESGSIEGSSCGAIASATDENARILNCASYAEIHGETADGLAGGGNGTVQNCIGPFAEADAASLNQGLCGLGGSYEIDDWYLWEMTDGVISLSAETADKILSVSTKLRIDREDVSLSAYYSGRDEAWCFALPAGCEETEMDVEVRFSDGETVKMHRPAGAAELICEKGAILHPIEFVTARKVSSLMIHTSTGDALSYLHAGKKNKVPGSYMFFDEYGEMKDEGILDKMRGHGNDSWNADKKSYNLTFRESVDFFDTGAGQNYVLLAAYRDNSLLAYKLTYDLSNEIGMDYPPKADFVHLYVDGEYLGMYLLIGKIEIGEDRFALKDMYAETERVNRSRLENYELKEWHSEVTSARRFWSDLDNAPEDVTGGYILEIDNIDYDVLKSRFVTDRNMTVVLRSMPHAAKEQIDYIAGFWQDFEDALYAEDGYNGKGKHYTEYIDVESFADQWLMYELNEDYSFSSSIYFYKDSDLTGDGLIHASWLWDMEHSLTYNDEKASRSFFAYYCPNDWWMQLYRHEDFAEVVYREWMQKFLPALEKVLLTEQVDNSGGIGSLAWYLEEFGDDGRLNNTRWQACNYEDKMARIQFIYTVRKDFLTKSLALYDQGYSYHYEADGVFYGVTASGDEVVVERQEKDAYGKSIVGWNKP